MLVRCQTGEILISLKQHILWLTLFGQVPWLKAQREFPKQCRQRFSLFENSPPFIKWVPECQVYSLFLDLLFKETLDMALNNIQMFKNIIILLVVAPVILGSSLTAPTKIRHRPTRATLSHSSYLMPPEHHLRHRLRSDSHDGLSQKAPLGTSHVGFELNITVQGLMYKMSMDTGSSDIFIKGENSTGVPEKKYQSGEDYMKLDQVFIGYLDGYLSCYVKTLEVELNGIKINTPLLVAYENDDNFDDQDGLIGLSYPSLARHKPTFIQTLIDNKVISRYAYGMNLNLIQDGRSFITFGDSDPTLFTGDLKEYKILGGSTITIYMDWIKVGDSDQLSIPIALLDTGNTCITVPERYQKNILDQFNKGDNYCVFSIQLNVRMFSLLICKIRDFEQLPDVTINIQGNEYKIQKQFYLQTCTKNPEDDSEFYCDTYIESVSSGFDSLFLGDGFFNRFYTFFDLENQKVGIATNKENITVEDVMAIENQFDPEDWQDLEQEKEK